MDDRRTRRDLLEELGRWRVRAARGTGKARVSLRDLSAATGVPHNSLSNYLTGATQMPADVLDAVVLALGATHEQAREWATAWERAITTETRPAAKATVIPRQLPAAVTAFTGRRQFLGQLKKLRRTGRRIVVIAGTAGVGKTALTVQWAHSVVDDFPDGQLYVNLQGYAASEPMPPSTALERFLRALGVAEIPSGLEERAALYRSVLSERRILVVLDNARTADQIRPLLPGAATCLAVVTSRSRLAGLVARDGAYRLDLERLSDIEAGDLLGSLLGSRIADDAEACAKLVRLCAGLPLALRVAAERIASRGGTLANPVAELAQVANALDVLNDAEDELSDIRAVFSWSYGILEAPPARLFRLLGLNPCPDIDAWAAANLAGLDYIEAQRQLATLAGAHLLEPSADGRFGMHDLLRAYAVELATAVEKPTVRRAAVTRLLDWRLSTVDKAMELLFPGRNKAFGTPPVPARTGPDFPGTEAAMAWMETERSCTTASVRFAAENGWPQHAWQIACAIWQFFHLRSYLDDWADTHRYALAAARLLDDHHAEAAVLHGLGLADSTRDSFEAAIEKLQAALHLRRVVGDRRGEGSTTNALGNTYYLTGHLQQALDYYQQAFAIAKGDHPVGELMILGNIARVSMDLGRYREAVQLYTEIIDRHRAADDRRGEAWDLNELARIRVRQGEFAQALDMTQRSAALCEEIGDRHAQQAVLDTMALAYLGYEQYDQALKHSSEALRVAREIEDLAGEADALNTLGRIHLGKGEPSAALQYHKQALEIGQSVGQPRLEGVFHVDLGMTYLALGKHHAAVELFRNAATLAARTDRFEEGRAEHGIGLALLAASDHDGARLHLQRGWQFFVELELPQAEAIRLALEGV